MSFHASDLWSSESPTERIRRDVDAAVELRITGTPLIIANGYVVRGYVPLDSIRRLIAAEGR